MSVGIENLKKCGDLVASVGSLVAKAREDDGEITFSDLLSSSVWQEAKGFGALVYDLYYHSDALTKEAKDLTAEESVELIQHFLECLKPLIQAFSEFKEIPAEEIG